MTAMQNMMTANSLIDSTDFLRAQFEEAKYQIGSADMKLWSWSHLSAGAESESSDANLLLVDSQKTWDQISIFCCP